MMHYFYKMGRTAHFLIYVLDFHRKICYNTQFKEYMKRNYTMPRKSRTYGVTPTCLNMNCINLVTRQQSKLSHWKLYCSDECKLTHSNNLRETTVMGIYQVSNVSQSDNIKNKKRKLILKIVVILVICNPNLAL